LARSFVSGKFKVLHSGHVRLFKSASHFSNHLIVGLDITGLSLEEAELRSELIRSLSIVKEVVFFEDNPIELLRKLKPDFVIKGSEFSDVFNIEEEIVKSYGGKLIFSSGASYQNESQNLNVGVLKIEHDESFLLRRQINFNELYDVINAFKNLRVCVIGDLIVDEYVQCKPLGMSQESPSIVVTPLESMKFVGGAGIIASHCASLGADTTFLSTCGLDQEGEWAKKEIEKCGVKVKVYDDPMRKTVKKVRYFSNNQMLFRINFIPEGYIAHEVETWIAKTFEDSILNFDLIIFSDFSYGMLSDQLTAKLIEIAKTQNLFVAADCQSSSQIGNLGKFKNCDLVTPTEREARIETKDESSGLVVLAEKLRRKLSSRKVILKLGSEGLLISSLADNSNDLEQTDEITALNKIPIDTSGAGDSLLAGSSMALALGKNIYLSAYLGSMMSALQVSRKGNVPIRESELLSLLEN
jgi:rfaE bifunctional protein kinase chain/domain